MAITTLDPSIDPVLQPLWLAADRAGIRAVANRRNLDELTAAVAAATAASTSAAAAHTAAKNALAAAVTANDPTVDRWPLWLAADRAGIRAAAARDWLADRQTAAASLTLQVNAAEAAYTAAKDALAAAIA